MPDNGTVKTYILKVAVGKSYVPDDPKGLEQTTGYDACTFRPSWNRRGRTGDGGEYQAAATRRGHEQTSSGMSCWTRR